MLKTWLYKHRDIFHALANRLTIAAVVWLAAALSLCSFIIWAFAALTEEVTEGDTRRFDFAVLHWIGRTFPSWLDEPMRLITALGYYTVVIPLLAAVLLFFYLKGWRLSATLLFVSTVGGIFLTTVLKSVFQRARPDIIHSGYQASGYSFPSGHATVAVGFYGMLTLLLAYRLHGALRWIIVACGVLLVLLIGFSRLYLGVHYLTDVLAGYLSAPLWVISVGAVYVVWLSIRGLRTSEQRREKD